MTSIKQVLSVSSSKPWLGAVRFRSLMVGALWLALLQAQWAQAQFGGGMGGMGGMGRRGMSNSYPRENSARDSSKNNERTTSVDQILYQLSTLQIDLKLSAEQESRWFDFSEAVRAYVDDQVRQKFKDQSRQMSPNEANTGLSYLAQLVDNSSHQYSDLEEIEIKAKALYPVMNNAQRVLFDLRIPSIVTAHLFLSPMNYPPLIAPSSPGPVTPLSDTTSNAPVFSAPPDRNSEPKR
jgi:hypothetical protein